MGNSLNFALSSPSFTQRDVPYRLPALERQRFAFVAVAEAAEQEGK